MSDDDGANEIGQAGLRTASAVVEQMLRLTRQIADGRWPVTLFGTPEAPDEGETHAAEHNGNEGNGSNGATAGVQGRGRAADIRALRANAERLIELYGDWTRSLLDGLSDLADAGDAAPGDVVVLGPVAPGHAATATTYLHLLDGPLARAPDVHATDLTAHHRGRISGDDVDVAVLDDATPTPDRLTFVVTVTVPDGTSGGVYHGHLLVDGMPDVHLPLRLLVTR